MGEALDHIRSAVLEGVPHGFFGRRGGVSSGPVSGLQVGLGAGDDPANIAENRRRAAEAVCANCDIATVYQVHSAEVAVVERPWPDRERPRADALVADMPGVLLAIVTADCAPVLLADREANSGAGVIGAAHAGWRGALAGVVENTVTAMADLGARPERIAAVIGPAIAQASYEVDEGFRARFTEPGDGRYFAPGAPGRWQFDLPGYVEARLRRADIGRIDRLDLDTYADETRFYSYRRASHRGEATYGRQFSLIAL